MSGKHGQSIGKRQDARGAGEETRQDDGAGAAQVGSAEGVERDSEKRDAESGREQF